MLVPVAVTTVLNWRAAIGTRLETGGARSAVMDPCHNDVWRQAFHSTTSPWTHRTECKLKANYRQNIRKSAHGLLDIDSSDQWSITFSPRAGKWSVDPKMARAVSQAPPGSRLWTLCLLQLKLSELSD